MMSNRDSTNGGRETRSTSNLQSNSGRDSTNNGRSLPNLSSATQSNLSAKDKEKSNSETTL